MKKKSFYRLKLLLAIAIVSMPANIFAAKTKEFRGVWLHQTHFERDQTIAIKQVKELFDSYAKIGINNLFCYYTTKDENHLNWDYLQLIIDEGHKRNIAIHPVFCPGHTEKNKKIVKEHPDLFIKDINGKLQPNYNLANPDARKYWINKIKNVMKYDIDGIHLDYIRFPVNQMFSYDDKTMAEFKKIYGITPLEDSHDVGSIIWCEWIQWNSKQVTEMVREIRNLINKSNKKLLLGIDAFPGPAEAKVQIAQDWHQWVKQNLVDFVCPMLYINSTDLFTEYLDTAIQNNENDCPIYPGIGIKTSHNHITNDILLKEINIVRSKGLKGMIFFSGNSLNEDFISYLGKTAFKTKQ